jgi:hypothetical protein
VPRLQNLMLSIIIGYLAATGVIIVVDLCFMLWTAVLMSKHNNIAKKWGHKIKRFRHMYKVFTPWFMVRCVHVHARRVRAGLHAGRQVRAHGPIGPGVRDLTAREPSRGPRVCPTHVDVHGHAKQ